MKIDVEESRETRWDTSVAMSDDDEPLIPRMPNQGKSIIRWDMDNYLVDLVQRKPKPHSQSVSLIHGKKDHTMPSLTFQKKK